MSVQRKSDSGDVHGTAAFQMWDSIITDDEPERHFPQPKRTPGSNQSLQGAQWASCHTNCLKALHSPSTETLSKGQEWKGMVPGFDGPFCHLALLWVISSKMGWETLLASLQISVWKSRKTDTFLSRLSEGLAITIVINYSDEKGTLCGSAFLRIKLQKYFLKRNHRGECESIIESKISQPQNVFEHQNKRHNGVIESFRE